MGNQEVSNKNHTFFALQGQMFGLVYQLSQVTLESQTQYILPGPLLERVDIYPSILKFDDLL